MLEKVVEYLLYWFKNVDKTNVPDMDIPPELCLQLLQAADYLGLDSKLLVTAAGRYHGAQTPNTFARAVYLVMRPRTSAGGWGDSSKRFGEIGTSCDSRAVLS